MSHVHVVARHSDHFIQRFEGQPGVVVRAVTDIVHAAQTHTPVPVRPWAATSHAANR